VCFISRGDNWRTVVVISLCVLLLFSVPLSAAEPRKTRAELFSRLDLLVPEQPMQMDDIVLPGLDGRIVSVRKQSGRLLFLTFWASWCPDCRREMPSVVRLYAEYKDKGLTVVGVNLMESPNLVRAFQKEFHLNFPLLLDRAGETSRRFSLHSIPTTYLVDQNGMVVGIANGSREWDSDTARALFDLLLSEESGPTSQKPNS
jgi:thiol-disulfide isomerase/thioredoxin